MRYHLIIQFCIGFAIFGAADAEETEEPYNPELSINFNMKDDDQTLSPETKAPEEEAMVKRIQAEYTQQPIINTRNSEEKVVGEWASNEVNFEQSVTIESVKIWWKEIDEGYSNDCDWTFTIKMNDEQVDEYSFECGEQKSDEEVFPAEYSFSEIMYNLVAGDKFSVQITYEGTEDFDLYYDNVTYDTGYRVKATPLAFFTNARSGSSFSIEFAEAWETNWETNLDSGYVMLMGAEGHMADNKETYVSSGGEYEINTGNGTDTVTTTKITWNGVSKDELTLMVDYTFFDHRSMNGTAKQAIVMISVEAKKIEEDDEGILGMPGFEVIIAVPAIAFAARRTRN